VGTFEGDDAEGDADDAAFGGNAGDANLDAAFGFGAGFVADLYEVAVFVETAALYFFFELFEDLLVVVEAIHVVVGEGEFCFEITVHVEHGINWLGL
jgi:hypothetical protein